MLNKALNREFEKGLQGSLYYFWGEENLFLEEVLSAIIETVISSHPVDFNYDVYHPASRVQEILDAAATVPFMAPRRLVVLKEFHQFPVAHIKALTPYFMDPFETTCMVILSQKAPKASWKFDWNRYDLNIKERDIPAWLKQCASRKGLRLTADAVDYLLEYVGYSAGLLMAEVEKLALSGERTVTGKDIVSSTSMMRKFTSFDLLDALISGRKTQAFRILKVMLAVSAFEATVILGTLNWHYRQFYSLWLHKGKRPLKMRERTYRALVSYLPSFSEKDFFLIFHHLHDADLGVKSSGRPDLVLELLLIKLLQKGARN